MSKKHGCKCYFGCVVDGTLHRFPSCKNYKTAAKDHERYNQWKTVLDPVTIERGDTYIRNSVLICYRHFEAAVRLPSGILTKNAIPTLNLVHLYHDPSTSIEETDDCQKISPRMITDNVDKRIVWVDLEMTGLDIEKDHILEIACVVTDSDLNVVAEGPNLVINQSDEVLNNMNQWCISQHGETGLTEASRKSKIKLKDAEKQVLDFVKNHVLEKKSPLGGNSVYMDRLFLRKYMPKLDDYLHYRIIDVSTIKELARRWYQKEYSGIPQKKFKHRAVDDIHESIQELKYYRENVFKSDSIPSSCVKKEEIND